MYDARSPPVGGFGNSAGHYAAEKEKQLVEANNSGHHRFTGITKRCADRKFKIMTGITAQRAGIFAFDDADIQYIDDRFQYNMRCRYGRHEDIRYNRRS